MTPEQHVDFLGSVPETKSFVDILIRKYNLSPNSYYTESPCTDNFQKTEQAKKDYLTVSYRNGELNEKWKERIPQGWYGFDLGYPVPRVFFDVIDEFLEYVAKECVEFKIYQIKSKFSSVRIYLGNINEKINKDIDELTAAMDEKFLVY